jgi:hypothetical protein
MSKTQCTGSNRSIFNSTTDYTTLMNRYKTHVRQKTRWRTALQLWSTSSVIDLRPHMRNVIVSVGVTGHCLVDNTPGAARGSRLYTLTLPLANAGQLVINTSRDKFLRRDTSQVRAHNVGVEIQEALW